MAHENILKIKRAKFGKIPNTREFTAKNMFVVNVGLTWGF